MDLSKKFESAEKNPTQESAAKKEASEEVSGASKRIGGKDSTMAVANPPGSSGVEAEQPATAEERAENNNRERAIVAANPNMHWSDVMMQAEKSRVIDIRDTIQARINKLQAELLS